MQLIHSPSLQMGFCGSQSLSTIHCAQIFFLEHNGKAPDGQSSSFRHCIITATWFWINTSFYWFKLLQYIKPSCHEYTHFLTLFWPIRLTSKIYLGFSIVALLNCIHTSFRRNNQSNYIKPKTYCRFKELGYKLRWPCKPVVTQWTRLWATAADTYRLQQKSKKPVFSFTTWRSWCTCVSHQTWS